MLLEIVSPEAKLFSAEVTSVTYQELMEVFK
jgi:F0F1-type ATP synthase epsilon subunit